MREEIAKFLKRKDQELVTGITVGYSTEYPYERKKKSLSDIMEWYNG